MDKDKKIIYYDDELNNEFSVADIKPKCIDGKYNYLPKNVFWKISSFFWYRIVATPFGFIYTKTKFKHKIVGKEKLKGIKTGFFMYGNHTQEIADALIPSLINFPRKTYVIVHANNVSIKGLGRVTHRMGALPLPDDMQATKNFVKAVDKCVNKNACVTIYPEAHIWPYYIKIRPFKDTSFRYPVQLKVPTFSFTNTYQKTPKGKVQIVTYIDGPFYPNEVLDKKEQIKGLRDCVYNTMVERSKMNNVEVIEYIKKEKTND